MKRTFLCLATSFLFATAIHAQIINHWRGPNRDGVYPEKNLLQSWPESGPTMLWSYQTLGKGYTSPTIVNGKIYITGLEGEKGFLHIFSEKGDLLKKYEYGADVFTPSGYPGPRSSPLLDGNLCYLVSGFGVLYCMDVETGKTVWSKNLFTDFDGKNIRFNFTENMLIDGNKLYIAPGGVVNNVVALDKKTGNLIWTSPGMGDLSAYCSPILINHNGKQMYVNMMAKNVIGLDPKDGKLLWSHPYQNSRSIHPNAPLYLNGDLYVFSGYGLGGQKLTLNKEGTAVSVAWSNKLMDNQMGGVILKNGYLYGSGDTNRKWFCIDWAKGDTTYSSKELDKGTVIEADDLLYAFTEKGELALIKPEPRKFQVVSKTKVTLGSDQFWAHLVINNGVLYVRHGNVLMAYDIRKK